MYIHMVNIHYIYMNIPWGCALFQDAIVAFIKVFTVGDPPESPELGVLLQDGKIAIELAIHVGVNPKIGVVYPPKWLVCFTMENPIKIHEFGGYCTPIFGLTPMCFSLQRVLNG